MTSIMSHLVLGYPTLAHSIRTAERYIAAGCGILELQIPFSHPTADGPVITRACRVAVEEQHTSTQACLDAMFALHRAHPAQEMMAMSYLNRVYAYGTERFAAALRTAGIRHLIVPDLPVDAAQAAPLADMLVPVLAANVSDARLERIVDAGHDFFYLMSDFKITGSAFSLNPRLKDIVSSIRRRRPGARVGIGFGISTAAQVRAVLSVADYAIVGSALIEAEDEGRLDACLLELGRFAATNA